MQQQPRSLKPLGCTIHDLCRGLVLDHVDLEDCRPASKCAHVSNKVAEAALLSTRDAPTPGHESQLVHPSSVLQSTNQMKWMRGVGSRHWPTWTMFVDVTYFFFGRRVVCMRGGLCIVCAHEVECQ